MPYALLHSISILLKFRPSLPLFLFPFPFQLIETRADITGKHPRALKIFLQTFVEFWKSVTMPDHHETDGMVEAPKGMLVVSSPLEKVLPKPMDCLDLAQLYGAQDRIEKVYNGKEDGTDEFQNTSMGLISHHTNTGAKLHMQLPSYMGERSKTDINSTQYESSLFSSSFSDVFGRKLRLPVNDTLFHQPTDNNDSFKNVESFKSIKEVEPPNIGNFLPDDDDLLSGMIDELGFTANASCGDDVEEVDLFSSGGGMELGGDEHLCAGQGISDCTGRLSNGQVVSSGSAIGEVPSRTIFARNISSSVEDSELRVLFEQYGDIRALFTACKHRGFVAVSYYDIRSARNAMRALQNKQLRGRKLDMHYSIPKDDLSEKITTHGTVGMFDLDSSVTNADLHQIFGVYGEIREIREGPHSQRNKFIEFFDVRAAEAALDALNRKTMSGKQINLEPGWPEGARCAMQIGCSRLERNEHNMSQSLDQSTMSRHIVSPGLVTSHCMDNESTKGLHSAIQVPTLHCPVSGAFGSRNGPPRHSLEQTIIGSNCVPSSLPHSLPEYHNYIGNIIPSNSISTVDDMVGNINAKFAGDSMHIGRMVSKGQPVAANGEVLCFGNSSCTLTGHHSTQNNSYQHHPSGSIIWPNSPTYVDGIQTLCPPKLTGYPMAPPHMLNMAAPVHHHHVGSAPAVDAFIWDRRHVYAEKSSKVSGFLMGSPGTFPLLPPDIGSRNMFPHAGGSCMNVSPNSGMHSPHQTCHIFPGIGPIMSSYGSPGDHARGFLHRRHDVSSSYADKKQYELDIDRILHGEDKRTTLMIKNIPNKYTSKMLLAAIDEHHRGMYDFVYLPIDFKNKCNVGYAFINLIDPLQIVPFHQTFNGKRWEKFNSEKVATLAYARIQGKAALIAHFQNSSLMNEDKRCRPILFHTDGPNAGDQEPFPTSGNIRSRSSKPRSFGNEGGIQYQGSPSSSNFEDSSSRGGGGVSSSEHTNGPD